MRQVVRLSEDRGGHVDKDPALTLDRGGRLWVAWHSYKPKADRIMARSCKGSRRGELVEISERAGINFQPSIACDGQNRIWVMWSAIRNGHWCILARPVCDGHIGPVVRLSENTLQEGFPCATGDARGCIWVAWVSLRNGRHQIVGRFLSDGRWSESVLLSHGSGECFRPVLCSDAEGAWLAYETCRAGGYDLFLRRWTRNGPGRPMKFSMTDSWEMFARLCTDGKGGVWATWIATHDVTNSKGFIDHKVEAMAAHFDGKRWRPHRNRDRSKPAGYVTHLCDGLLGRQIYMGFVGWRRRPQIVRDDGGDVWLVYERKEDETVNQRGRDALFYARPLTGSARGWSFEIDRNAYAYTVNGDLPVVSGQLPFAGQIPSGKYYADICTGTLQLDRTRPVGERPASDWKAWRRIPLPEPPTLKKRPTMKANGKTYKLYWGDLHCHGNLSGDAEGEIDENYTYGRYKSRLDFMAVTDNDVIYDNMLTPSEWALIRAEADHFNDPGGFVAVSAYERTYQKSRKEGPNHFIIVFPDGEAPLYHYTEPDADTLEKWVAKIEPTRAFAFPHHPTWWAVPSSRLGGVELCSCWDVYIHMKDTIPQHLREGYRLAFMGNSDSHRIVPGLGGALTGLWAEALTREAIFEALWAKRCFATNGERMVLDVRIKGVPMGTEVAVDEVVTVSCRVRAPRPVSRIELFRDGRKVLERKVGKKQATLKLKDHPGAGEHFYYVRVQLKPMIRAAMRGRGGNLQVAHGDYAWSSPIWVKVG